MRRGGKKRKGCRTLDELDWTEKVMGKRDGKGEKGRK